MTFLAFVLILADTLLYLGQGFFRKLFSITAPKPSDSSLFCILYGVIVAVATFVYNGFGFHADLPTIEIGALNGVVLFTYNISGIEAEKRGPYIFQNLLSVFGNILIPLGICIFYWGDSITPLKTIGIIIILLSFVIYNQGGKISFRQNKVYLICVILVFLSNGIYSALLDAQQRLAGGAMRNEMIIVTYAVSALLSLLFALLRPKMKPQLRGLPAKKWIFALLSSLCAAAAVNLLMLTLRYASVSVLYPTVSGSLMILNTLLSIILLKERPDKWQWIGLPMALIGIVILNLV